MKNWIVRYVNNLGNISTARLYCKRPDIGVALKKSLKVKLIPEIVHHHEMRSERGH